VNEPENPNSKNSDGGLFVTDAELLRRLGMPEKIGRRAIRELDKRLPGRAPFPGKDPLFGDRRYWPAVVAWFDRYFGVPVRRFDRRDDS
jgi:hypothetical protein